MLKVEITDETIVTTNRGAYTFYEQSAWVTFLTEDGKPEPHPQKVELQLRENQPAWKRGTYQIHPCSFYRNRYGNIALGRLHLVPLKIAAAA